MEEHVVIYQVADGEDLIITHYGKPIFLEKGKEIVVDKGGRSIVISIQIDDISHKFIKTMFNFAK